ncbi:DUF3099 domain-containing protein [Arthrobacter sp. I2-34]|uniref:DUF3099 domain-containing protein n=1 Tax=Arthrobacter hankyongi TaxID=2904801 RepID=A0ABS9L6H1_9MICC|nr:DUF3099 domain-containing protein [Arthrobacter hankyongi]MCG2622087.1 DUF3099 domain-containing protein [Arthrobacter hankyongi]
MSARSDNNGEVLNITDAHESHTDEMHRRMVKYTIAMSIRLACLLLFFFIPGWPRWLFVAGAVFLPWIAVVIANGGADQNRIKASDALLDQAPLDELPSAESIPGQDEVEILPGEVVEDEDQPQDPPGGQDGRTAA